ncbi:MAG: transposase [Candidatus Methylomirabilia bacterium]
MRDVELYRAILGLKAPWTVTGVDLDVKGQQVVVRVEAGPGPFPCSECETAVPRYDSKPRRHLDTCQFTTWIEAEVPRVSCPAPGVKQVRIPWAEPGSQFTALFERWTIDLLRECSVRGAAQLLRITWDEAWGISRLRPMAEVAKLVRRHLPNLLTYLRHRITNAGLEAVNGVIQWVKKTARGFRNPEHFKTAIYFHCGGLDLYPHQSL